MIKPAAGKLIGIIGAAALSFRKFASVHKRQFGLFALALSLVVVLVLGFGVMSAAVLRNRRRMGEDRQKAPGYSIEAARVLRDLYMPGPAVGELPFPLAFEPDPGYTERGLSGLYNDMSGIDIRELTAKRKAVLEAIYNAID
jgi:hypothetical protein